MRSVTTTLAAKQGTLNRTPYFDLNFSSSGQLNSRVMKIRHEEWPYSGKATITLDNHDRTIPELRGQYVEIGYGDVTTAGNETAATPRLWVLKQHNTSAPGKCVTQLSLIDGWTLMAAFDAILGGTSPYYEKTWNKVHTPFYLINSYAFAAGFNSMLTYPDDGLINTLLPYFMVNQQPIENIQEVIYRLICLTKLYMRAKPGKNFELVYPQAGDAAVLTYQLGTPPLFQWYDEVSSESIPNRWSATCKATLNSDGSIALKEDGTEDWTNKISGVATDDASIARLGKTISRHYTAADIDNQTDADNFAAAIKLRADAESLSASMLIPHDNRIELHDRLAVIDPRGFDTPQTFPSNPMARVTGLVHIAEPGVYNEEVYFGGLANLLEIPTMPTKAKPDDPGNWTDEEGYIHGTNGTVIGWDGKLW